MVQKKFSLEQTVQVSDTTKMLRSTNARQQKNMDTPSMHLKILLPFKVFADINDVSNIVMETSKGSYGLLPQRLDCVAALVPGIFMYETKNDGAKYIAVDAGVMVKAGTEVLVSVRNAIGGVELGKLSELVKHEFETQEEVESNVRSVTAKLEIGFIYSFDKFSNM